jgi:hypothetical protein
MVVHYLYEGNVMINLFMYIFTSCAKDMAKKKNLIIVRKFNEGIATTITLVD